ncbi:MAG: hypothetical protein ABIG89_02125 [Candidatus Woesearchaeota archaeon]
MKKTINYENIFMIVLSVIVVVLVTALLATDDAFAGKASLAIQGYSVADLSNDDIDDYKACIASAEFEYPAHIYGHQDRYCDCIIGGFEGCEIYISDKGNCNSGYLPDSITCGDKNNINTKDFQYHRYQFSDCSSKAYKLQRCHKGCDDNLNVCKEDICVENDRGYNIFEMSTIKGQDFKGVRIDKKDECASPNKINEYYCDKGFIKSRIEQCEYGCIEGACQKIKCTDSDGGKNMIFIKGIVDGGQGGSAIRQSDRCEDSTTLQEYFCGESGTIGYTKVQCENGCLGGICVYSVQ